jgi:hypothetical protein
VYKVLADFPQLPNLIVVLSATQVAHDLRNINIKKYHRFLTLDIKDLYAIYGLKRLCISLKTPNEKNIPYET